MTLDLSPRQVTVMESLGWNPWRRTAKRPAPVPKSARVPVVPEETDLIDVTEVA